MLPNHPLPVGTLISTLMNLFYRTAHHLTLLPALAPRRTFKRPSRRPASRTH